jgi:hypothetical protein
LEIMPSVSIKAHFDGERIQLDEPFDIPPDTPLLVTVLPVTAGDPDRAVWMEVGRHNLARAFADNEPEYTLADVRR